jgi:hypothetical protein
MIMPKSFITLARRIKLTVSGTNAFDYLFRLKKEEESVEKE